MHHEPARSRVAGRLRQSSVEYAMLSPNGETVLFQGDYFVGADLDARPPVEVRLLRRPRGATGADYAWVEVGTLPLEEARLIIAIADAHYSEAQAADDERERADSAEAWADRQHQAARRHLNDGLRLHRAVPAAFVSDPIGREKHPRVIHVEGGAPVAPDPEREWTTLYRLTGERPLPAEEPYERTR